MSPICALLSCKGSSVTGLPRRIPDHSARRRLLAYPFGLQRILEGLFIDGFIVGSAGGDLLVGVEAADGGVHVDHPFLHASLDGRGDLRGLSFTDHVADGWGGEEDLQGRYSSAAELGQ